MEERKSYFVSIEKEEITEVSIPDTTEFEIKATDSDIAELNNLFREKNKSEKKTVVFVVKALNDWGADDEIEEYDIYLRSIYNLLYQLGTLETKQKIERRR